MTEELPKFERLPILPKKEEQDKEIWQPSWNCFCCQDTGQIQAHLVRLIIPDYNPNRDRIVLLLQLDLCSGVGAGFCLAGLQRGFNLIGTAEIDEYCSGILELRYPGTHNYGDVQKLAYTGAFGLRRGAIDLITASPPCPPFSTEGDRKGADDERDCFPAVLEIINKYKPKFAAG